MKATRIWQNKQKKKKKKKKVKHKNLTFYKFFPFIIITTLIAIILIGAYASYQWIFKDLPSPRRLNDQTYAISTEIYDRNGELLYEIFANQNRKPISIKDVPTSLINATIAIEDKDFYRHKGVAIRGIIRAFYKNLSNESLQGGSTITQQLVKNALLTPERTIQRKIRELFLAWFTELIYSKDQIMELYLNYIPYGGTAYGIEQASHLYFGKTAKNLSLAESALIAGLPQSPSRYSPFGSTPELAKQRQIQVLTRMFEDGYISKQQLEQAKNEKLNFAQQRTDIKAPHFVMYVKDLLIDKYGSKKVEQGGLRVTTTLDLELQEYAQASLSAVINSLKDKNVSNGASLVTKPNTGEILAMIGSRGYFDTEIDGNVNLVTSLRQPGSSIKPLNYALGLLKGYTAATVFLDVPTCFIAAGQPQAYCPKNYDWKFHGPQQMRYSLANSYNIPAVKMLALNGLEDFIATASAMGISSWKDPSNYGLSLTLGGGELRMTELATAFGVFANSGIKIDLNPILEVKTHDGKILEENNPENSPPSGKRILPAEVTWIISNILSDNNARIPAFGANSKLQIPGKTVSVKTGTTDDLRDNWAVGYTPEYLTAVWVGNNDNSPMNPYVVSGITGATPIWNDIMSHLLENEKDIIPPKPQNVIGANVCSGELKPEENVQQCEGRYEYFIKGTEKDQTKAMIVKKNIWIDKETGQPPAPGKTDNLELKEKMVITDAFMKEYCIDCPHDNEPSQIINVDLLHSQTN